MHLWLLLSIDEQPHEVTQAAHSLPHLDEGSIDQVLVELRKELLELSHRLQDLWIFDRLNLPDVPEGTEEWADLIGDMVTRAECLRCCTLSLPANSSVLHELAKLKHLCKLEIAKIAESECFESPFSLPGGAFPKLRHLQLHEHATSAPLSRTLLSFPSNGCLQHVLVKVYVETSVDRVCDIIQLLGTHHSLTHVVLEFKDDVSGDWAAVFDALRPLPQLVSLNIAFRGDLTITTHHITSVLDLYPRLRSFRLQAHVPDDYCGRLSMLAQCPLSLNQLADVLEARPEMTRLPIYIDSAELTSLDAVAGLKYGPCLAMLEDVDSPEIRQAVSANFPCIKDIALGRICPDL
jgi:hypothetical protein